MLEKKAIIVTKGLKPIGPYSTAVSFNNLIFISGQIPVHPQTGKMPETIDEQTKLVLQNLRIQIEGAGCSMNDILQCQVFLTEMNSFAAMNKVYAEFFSEPYPTRMVIGVTSLPKGSRIEIAAIAGKK